MQIIVPIKQVPETSSVKMDPETGTMVRSGVECVVNPLDLYAIEAAISIKEQYGGKVTACTMGPPSAAKALREAVAMGCDHGILVSDKRFAGSDTWATSYTLAGALKQSGAFDLVICGERATDGDTGQVPPGLAAWLKLPLATYVSTIQALRADSVVVERLVEEGYQRLQVSLPAVVTVVKEIGTPRLPTLRGKKRARQADLTVWSADDIQLEPSCLGLNGSPTRVVKVTSPRVSRGGETVMAAAEEDVVQAVDALLDFLSRRGVR